MNRRSSSRAAIGLLFLLSACAAPATRPPQVSPGAVAAEEAIQRRFVIEELARSQRRLDDIGFPLLLAATPLCRDQTTETIGVRARTIDNYADGFAGAAAVALSLTDTLTVLGVAKGSPASEAGLAPGDRVLRTDGRPLPRGAGAAEAFSDAIASSEAARVRLEVKRGGSLLTVEATPVTACNYDLVVTAEGDINAYADGERVIVPWPMMRFADDEELTAIVGHEIAHNAMGHSDARIQNLILGGLLGAVLDVASGGDVDADSSATLEFMEAAAEAYSQDFEREADYVGAYIVARAGHPLEGVPGIWRKFASISPDAISYAGTHPTTAERFVRLGEIIEEIEAKIRAGEELLPEFARQ